MIQLIYGTGNPAKLAAMKNRLSDLKLDIIGLKDLDEEIPEVIEDGKTPLENARIKALAYYKKFKKPVFSCDSGLYFEDVPDDIQPGVHVRNVNGKHLSDQEMIDYYSELAKEYGGLKARYKNAIVLVMDEEHIYEAMEDNMASKPFFITSHPHKERKEGFPLDSLSIDVETGKYYYDLEKDELDVVAVEEGFLEFFEKFFEDGTKIEQQLSEKYNEILGLFNINSPKGYSKQSIEEAKNEVGRIPYSLEFFYEMYGKSDELLHLQDEFILPNKYNTLINDDYIIFFDENQGVCKAGVKKSDVDIVDPPVYVCMDNGEWVLSSEKVSDFLIAMFGYQASLCLDFSSEEFYFITGDELKKINKLFIKRPEKMFNWLDFEVILYGDNNGRIAIMNQEGFDIQMSYATNTIEEYQRIAKMLAGVGEAM